MFSHKTGTNEGSKLFSTKFIGPLELCKVPHPSYAGLSFLGQKDEMEMKWFAQIKHMITPRAYWPTPRDPAPWSCFISKKHVLPLTWYAHMTLGLGVHRVWIKQHFYFVFKNVKFLVSMTKTLHCQIKCTEELEMKRKCPYPICWLSKCTLRLSE